jgi:hypothetical protein
MEYPLSCLKLLPQTTYGYGMHFWCGWIQQWYQHVEPITIVHSPTTRDSSGGSLYYEW